ncbi:MAG: ATP synthase F0 subunit B, partial [Coriobacteriia bacterium]|nr:ATP synthase F0 subunit B [Coriobacteriia bacterium]
MFTPILLASEAAATSEASGGLASKLGAVYPNPADIWPTWVAFLILFFVLYKFALPPILAMLDKRAATII